MKKLRIYLDTSVVNFLFAEDSPDFRRVTEDFFARHEHKYELFTSWNFKHLANVRREKLIAEINRSAGYPELLRLLSPLEVEDENQD